MSTNKNNLHLRIDSSFILPFWEVIAAQLFQLTLNVRQEDRTVLGWCVRVWRLLQDWCGLYCVLLLCHGNLKTKHRKKCLVLIDLKTWPRFDDGIEQRPRTFTIRQYGVSSEATPRTAVFIVYVWRETPRDRKVSFRRTSTFPSYIDFNGYNQQ